MLLLLSVTRATNGFRLCDVVEFSVQILNAIFCAITRSYIQHEARAE